MDTVTKKTSRTSLLLTGLTVTMFLIGHPAVTSEIGTADADPLPSTPPCELVVPGSIIVGDRLEGSFRNGTGPIEVTATYNGVQIGQTSSSGNDLDFDFSSDGVPEGGTIEIEASVGNSVVKTAVVQVVR